MKWFLMFCEVEIMWEDIKKMLLTYFLVVFIYCAIDVIIMSIVSTNCMKKYNQQNWEYICKRKRILVYISKRTRKQGPILLLCSSFLELEKFNEFTEMVNKITEPDLPKKYYYLGLYNWLVGNVELVEFYMNKLYEIKNFENISYYNCIKILLKLTKLDKVSEEEMEIILSINSKIIKDKINQFIKSQ